MANFFKAHVNKLFGEASEESETPVFEPSASSENPGQNGHYELKSTGEDEPKEITALRGQTEVLAEANFRTIVRSYQISQTNNGRELADKSASK